MKHLLTIFAVIILLSATNLYADVIYVKQGATGTGVSWVNAFGTLQEALDEAESGDEIWVAEGTYYPTHYYDLADDNERLFHFRMKNGVEIYGGFPATGNPVMDDRDWTTYETILSGDIGTPSDNADNCYHVFYHSDGLGLDDTAVLDGFTITRGLANASGHPHGYGAGMYNDNNSPTILNCTFILNSVGEEGGGMANYNNSSPIVTNCFFYQNSGYRAGGMFIHTSSPVITDCIFDGNTGVDQAAMSIYSSSPVITDCIFKNHSAYNVGAIFSISSTVTFTNCEFTNNSTGLFGLGGGALFNDNSTIELINCTFSNNSANSAGDDGGAIYNYNNVDLDITNCTFENNSAARDGGAIYNNNSDLEITNSTFENNSASRWGGAIISWGISSEHQILNTVFNSNNASEGGGIWISNGVSTIINTLFNNNESGRGAIYLTHAVQLGLTNCTITENTSTSGGAGIYLDHSGIVATIRNSIFWNNQDNADNGNEFFINLGTINVDYSCYANSSDDIVNNQTLTEGANNIHINPLFVGVGPNPFTIVGNSPCVDEGNNALVTGGITTDIIGNDRIVNTTVDMGAYEAPIIVTGLTDKTDVCYNSEVEISDETTNVTGGSEPYTYSWSPSFLLDTPDDIETNLTRAIRNTNYVLTITDSDGNIGYASVGVEVLPGNVITAPGTIVHSFRAEDITEPLNLFALALGEDYEDIYDGEDYDLEFECRLGWLPPGEVNCEEFDPTYYLPLPNSRLYGWIIIYHSESGCEADRRRINVVVRGNELGENEDS